jgi:hypothetical protein
MRMQSVLSLQLLLLKNRGRFEGDFLHLKVYDNSGTLTVSGYDSVDGYWGCTYNELKNIYANDEIGNRRFERYKKV